MAQTNGHDDSMTNSAQCSGAELVKIGYSIKDNGHWGFIIHGFSTGLYNYMAILCPLHVDEIQIYSLDYCLTLAA